MVESDILPKSQREEIFKKLSSLQANKVSLFLWSFGFFPGPHTAATSG